MVRPSSHSCVCIAAASLFNLLPFVTAASAQPNIKGQWSTAGSAQFFSRRLADNSIEPNGAASHVVLLRGSGDSSKVLYFAQNYHPQLWTYDYVSGSSVSGVTVPVPYEHFVHCAGQSALADGRILLTGGHANATGLVGTSHVSIFDAKAALGAAPSGWTATGEMAYGRWYPCNTTLGDGTVLVTAGLDHFRMVTFGGIGADATRRADWNVLDIEQDPMWTDQSGLEISRCGPPPAAREGHSANYVPGWGIVVFGGIGQTAMAFNEVWNLKYHVEDPQRLGQDLWFWCPMSVLGQAPEPRQRHSAIVLDGDLIVFGGQRQDGSALNDLWRLKLSGTLAEIHWEPVLTSGVPPSARYGHTAILDPANGSGKPPQMLVFGGRDANGYADPVVYALTFGAPGEPATWSRVATAPVGACGVGGGSCCCSPGPCTCSNDGLPEPREGHAAVLVTGGPPHPGDPPGASAQMAIFGGRSPAIGFPIGGTKLDNDVWVLRRGSDPANITWRWQHLVTDTANTPSPRTRHTAVYDDQWQRLLVFGGQTAQSVVNEIWELTLTPTAHWRRINTAGPPAARAGHTAVYDPNGVQARIPERFDPSTGAWTRLLTAYKNLPYYPLTFLLSNGNVFWAGNRDDMTSLVLTNPTQPSPAWQSPAPSGFVGGNAVMYRPDRIMKCGGPYAAPDNRTAVIDLTAGTPAWTSTAPMPEARTYHSLTLLPTGQVLMTGGSNGAALPDPGVYKSPRIWDPNTFTWSADLDPDPRSRAYHSVALLLPDGRVLTAAAQPSELGSAIFSPPYLFKSSGAPADRPVIVSVSKTGIAYGEVITVKTDDNSKVQSVCLMRPGAPTHSFDQDQRYVPLAFSRVGLVDLSVTAPGNGNVAPPGDYMLFVVSATTPSIAKWVRLGSAGGGLQSSPSPASERAAGGPPAAFALLQNRPNPFVLATGIDFELPRASRVRVDIYDMQGRLVRGLADRPFEAGRWSLAWDRRSDDGQPMPPAVYFYRMTAGLFRGQRKMVMLP